MLIRVFGGVQALGASPHSVDKGCPSNEVLIANWSVTFSDALTPRLKFSSTRMSVGIYQEGWLAWLLGKKKSLKCNPETSRTLQALFIFCVLIKSSEREAKLFREATYACLDSCGSKGNPWLWQGWSGDVWVTISEKMEYEQAWGSGHNGKKEFWA